MKYGKHTYCICIHAGADTQSTSNTAIVYSIHSSNTTEYLCVCACACACVCVCIYIYICSVRHTIHQIVYSIHYICLQGQIFLCFQMLIFDMAYFHIIIPLNKLMTGGCTRRQQPTHIWVWGPIQEIMSCNHYMYYCMIIIMK